MMKRKLEWLVLGICIVPGLAWATLNTHFSGLGFRLDYLIDLSSLLTVAAFSVRAMLPLRVLAVASQFFAIPFFMLQPEPLWTPVGWTVLFMVINLYHITRILLERRPVGFTDDERQLYELTFHSLQPRDFLKLVKCGEWKTAFLGEKMLQYGQHISQISVPISGMVSASRGGVQIGTFTPGDMIGAGIVLTGQPSFIDADCMQEVRYICWSISDIQVFLDKKPDLMLTFNDIVNRHLVAQINKLALYLASGGRPGDFDLASQ